MERFYVGVECRSDRLRVAAVKIAGGKVSLRLAATLETSKAAPSVWSESLTPVFSRLGLLGARAGITLADLPVQEKCIAVPSLKPELADALLRQEALGAKGSGEDILAYAPRGRASGQRRGPRSVPYLTATAKIAAVFRARETLEALGLEPAAAAGPVSALEVAFRRLARLGDRETKNTVEAHLTRHSLVITLHEEDSLAFTRMLHWAGTETDSEAAPSEPLRIEYEGGKTRLGAEPMPPSHISRALVEIQRNAIHLGIASGLPAGRITLVGDLDMATDGPGGSDLPRKIEGVSLMVDGADAPSAAAIFSRYSLALGAALSAAGEGVNLFRPIPPPSVGVQIRREPRWPCPGRS